MSKERLTEKTKDCFGYRLKDGSDAEVGFFKDYGAFFSHMMVVKALGEYETLEEQGLLLRLPVAVGSTVYLINSRYTKCTKYEEEFDEYSCQGCEDECDSHKEYYIYKNKSVSAEWIIHNAKEINKTVFLTQSEAEEKLRELEREDK